MLFIESVVDGVDYQISTNFAWTSMPNIFIEENKKRKHIFLKLGFLKHFNHKPSYFSTKPNFAPFHLHQLLRRHHS